jgi:hypothetical protein
MRSDQDFLLYPLASAESPTCPGCGRPMEVVLHEARENLPDFSTFGCVACARSERFVCEH